MLAHQEMYEPALTEMAGYLIVPHERVPDTFNAGYSMYVAAWPLLKTYPGQQFQSGLFGTWMFPQFEGKAPKDHYTDVEGGLGWWRDTRFATETPKFIMGGVALNFSEWANGPGAGKGRDWSNPTGLYGIAQLSPYVIWPPDGLNLKQGTRGELFGYGYLPLPLTEPKTRTAGKDVPTGNQCWTLFLNSSNFKGPVAFFTPYFWSKASVKSPEWAGSFLDTRPSEPNRAVQMETQHIPAMVAKDRIGTLYAKIAPTQFPVGTLIHRMTVYSRDALWNQVEKWFKGGPAVKTVAYESASAIHTFKSSGASTWRIQVPGKEFKDSPPVDMSSFATPVALSETTFGYKWNGAHFSKDALAGDLVTLPEYYRLETDAKGRQMWKVIDKKEIPIGTGLIQAEFPVPKRTKEAYVTPEEPASSWKKPGPAAGPFKKTLGDGSEITYYWYRFADQPALQNADLTAEEREKLQKRVELIHKNWKQNQNYLPAPSVGKLAGIDPALLITPPAKFKFGYVPIVTRQGKR